MILVCRLKVKKLCEKFIKKLFEEFCKLDISETYEF